MARTRSNGAQSREDTPETDGSSARQAKRRDGGEGKKDGQAKEKKPRRGIRQRISLTILKVPYLRRRHVKRIIRYIDKSREKGRRLPPELNDLARYLSRVPKPERAQRLEEAILAQQNGDEEAFNRDMRRAALNQQRRSGKGAGGFRPGSPPRSMQQGPRPPKKPR